MNVSNAEMLVLAIQAVTALAGIVITGLHIRKQRRERMPHIHR